MKRLRNSFFNKQIEAVAKLDEKINECHTSYTHCIRASYLLKAAQLITAALVPVFALLAEEATKYPAAVLGGLIMILTGFEQKINFSKQAGKHKAHYELLLKERFEFINREGPYKGMRHKMRIHQISWRTDNVDLVIEAVLATPSSSSDDLLSPV